MNNIYLPTKLSAYRLVALFAIIASSLMVADQAKAQIITNASDNAGNYSGGWTNGANGGTGFGAWTINSFSSSNAFGGAFIGNPTNAGIATNLTFGSQAFGLYANPAGSGAFVNADRNFPALQVGQTFSFQWAINWDSEGGNKGFDIYSSGTQVLNVNQGSYPGDISLISGGVTNTNIGLAFGTGPMTWSFTRTSVTNLTVTSTGRDGSTNVVFTTNIPITGAPNSFRWYAAGMGASDNRQPYFNNLQVAGPAPTTITNQVTFSVNMSYQASQGLFSSNSDTVQLRSSFDNWSTNNQLTNQGNNIFGGTFNITGNEGSAVEYIFWNSSPLATNFGYETTGNRSLTLGAAGASTNLPTVFFSNLAGQRFVTFSVNMAIQQGKGAFNPPTNGVEVRGDFNGGWGVGNALSNAVGSVYSGTFLISSSNTNTSIPYKFFTTGTNAVGFESGGNRSFNLVFNGNGSNAPALVLATNFFNNELFYTTPTSLLGFATTQGTPSTNQSFMLVGLGLSNNISVTAPTDFELSANSGTSYSNTLSLAPSSGAYSNSILARIAAGAAQGSISNNIQIASPGSTDASVLVTGNVAAAANGYGNWLTNYPGLGANTNGTNDPDFDGFNNNLEFTFDGNPTVATTALMTVRTVGTNAVFNWIQRNTGVAYEVQKNSSLTNAWTAASGLSISNSTNQGGVLLTNDYTRKEFTLPASGKDFYRVKGATTNN